MSVSGRIADGAGATTPRPVRNDRPIARFLLRRTAAALATLLVVSMLVFAGTEVLPGDAASAVLGKTATPARLRSCARTWVSTARFPCATPTG